MTKAKEALEDFQENLLEMNHETEVTIIKALELLDNVERGGDDEIKQWSVHIPSKNVSSGREGALRGYNQALIDINQNYILIKKDSK